MANTATENQIKFITSLQAQRVVEGEALQAVELGRTLWRSAAFTKDAASAVIDALKAAPYANAGKDAPRDTAPAPEGMHKALHSIYKVQRAIHGSGNLYAKKLTRVEGSDDWTFEYAPGAMRILSEETKMTLEQAKEFGALYGTCCVCGRTLTDEKSIEAGIGPVCANKF